MGSFDRETLSYCWKYDGIERAKNKDNPIIRTFRELPVSLYLKFENPMAACIVHMNTRRAATITGGSAAMNPDIFPVHSANKLCY